MRVLESFLAWLGRKKPPVFVVRYADDLPEELEQFVLYVVGEDRHWWFAAMRCPCGCEETLYMSLNRAARPNWTLTRRWSGIATLTPSVRRSVGCESHFFLTNGRIRWV